MSIFIPKVSDSKFVTSETVFTQLLSPITLGGVAIRNRVVMGSMHTGLEDRPYHIGKYAQYLKERAEGGAGLLVTGGFSPNIEGWLAPGGSDMRAPRQARRHRIVTDGVHEAGGAIVLQILHAGRYSHSPAAVSSSSRKSPISRFTPRALSGRGVERTINDYVRAARLARDAGYDGVEIMGSEGYLINQFLAPLVNDRTDKWGGTPANRQRFPLEIVRRIREEISDNFIVMFRISLLDLVPQGQTFAEILDFAAELESAGVDLFNTGIGWHEARVPTILTQVPSGVWTPWTARLKAAVQVPVCASNRINTPEMGEEILRYGHADMISMARPLLADPQFVNKVERGESHLINTCIACNQACLDHAFDAKPVSCLVNPQAGRETQIVLSPTPSARSVAVVGAGPAGLSAAVALAERGFSVTLFEAGDKIGGQFRLAQRVPGKEDFAHTLRYFDAQLSRLGVETKLNCVATVDDLASFNEVILATGVVPRELSIPGADLQHVMSYADVLSGRSTPGERVAVIGAGGIGVDMASFLTHAECSNEEWLARWGVTTDDNVRGGLIDRVIPSSKRKVTILQRKSTRVGANLGKTSGWAHRQGLRDYGVKMLTSVTYERIDEKALHITVKGEPHVLEVDSIVVCAGQESERSLADDLASAGVNYRIIGGAEIAAELDAKRAIEQGTLVAASL